MSKILNAEFFLTTLIGFAALLIACETYIDKVFNLFIISTLLSVLCIINIIVIILKNRGR